MTWDASCPQDAIAHGKFPGLLTNRMILVTRNPHLEETRIPRYDTNTLLLDLQDSQLSTWRVFSLGFPSRSHTTCPQCKVYLPETKKNTATLHKKQRLEGESWFIQILQKKHCGSQKLMPCEKHFLVQELRRPRARRVEKQSRQQKVFWHVFSKLLMLIRFPEHLKSQHLKSTRRTDTQVMRLEFTKTIYKHWNSHVTKTKNSPQKHGDAKMWRDQRTSRFELQCPKNTYTSIICRY